MGSGLSVQDLVTDGAGNVLANHVYVGDNPLMRLDASGNAVYYLTDAMGSVIGLVDGSGQSVALFDYDGFGNVRGTSGSDAVGEALGGDFRFQGQWLESSTDLYNFRARYYDPETGRFISRDPVDIIETEPESSNPYQFVYNNPLIYSDPSGEFTLTELNSAQQGQFVLQNIRSYAVGEAKDYIKNLAGEVISNLVFSSLDAFLPFGSSVASAFGEGDNNRTAGNVFEHFITDAFCDTFTSPYSDYIYLQTQIATNGEPQNNGMGCPPLLGQNLGRTYPRPDFLFKKTEPTDLSEKSYLVGDIKIRVATMHTKYVKNAPDNQWKAIVKHARNYSYAPVAGFLTFYSDKTTDKRYEKGLQRQAISDGVSLLILSLR